MSARGVRFSSYSIQAAKPVFRDRRTPLPVLDNLDRRHQPTDHRSVHSGASESDIQPVERTN